MKEQILRKALEKIRKLSGELGFYVDDIDIDICANTERTVGFAIPVIVSKQWRVSIELRAPLENPKETKNNV